MNYFTITSFVGGGGGVVLFAVQWRWRVFVGGNVSWVCDRPRVSIFNCFRDIGWSSMLSVLSNRSLMKLMYFVVVCTYIVVVSSSWEVGRRYRIVRRLWRRCHSSDRLEGCNLPLYVSLKW